MTTKRGDVVLVQFPRSDLQQQKHDEVLYASLDQRRDDRGRGSGEAVPEGYRRYVATLSCYLTRPAASVSGRFDRLLRWERQLRVVIRPPTELFAFLNLVSMIRRTVVAGLRVPEEIAGQTHWR